jgi:hypothetical protein
MIVLYLRSNVRLLDSVKRALRVERTRSSYEIHCGTFGCWALVLARRVPCYRFLGILTHLQPAAVSERSTTFCTSGVLRHGSRVGEGYREVLLPPVVMATLSFLVFVSASR